MDDTEESTGTQTSFLSQPGIKEVLGTAGKLFNSGMPWAPDTTSHVSPFSTQTRQGLAGMQNVASGSVTPFAQNFARINATVGDGGLNNLQDQQVSRLQGLFNQGRGSGLNALQERAYNQLAPTANGLNGEQQQALDWLRTTASGDPASNPHLDEIIRRSSEDIALGSGMAASGAGRYGSGLAQGVRDDAIGDMSAKLRYSDFDTQQGRKDAAIRDFGSLGTTGASQRLNQLMQQAGLATTGENQRRDALGSLYNAGTQQRENVLAGTQQLQDAYQARLDPFRTMTGVGSAFENKNTQVLQDQARVLQDRKNAMTDPVNWLSNLASAWKGGTQVQGGTQPGTNPLASILGGAMSGYDLFGGPLGGVAGGIYGAL